MVYKVIGLMSGSSLDGLDIAYVHLQERAGTQSPSPKAWEFEFVRVACYPYPEGWRQRLASAPGLSALEYQLLHVEYGAYLGEQVLRFIEEHSLHYQVQLIASHGHTTFHWPARRLTAQLGDGAAIAAATRCNVVSDLRAMDVALGGQGAPIVPIGEQLLLPGYELFLNLGGIANISTRGAAGFDVCPANRVLNALAELEGKPYDAGGAMAAAGKVDSVLLEQLNGLPYYEMPYPKSLANEFGTQTVLPLIREVMAERGLSTADALRTYVEHIAIQVNRAVAGLGGGAAGSVEGLGSGVVGDGAGETERLGVGAAGMGERLGVGAAQAEVGAEGRRRMLVTGGGAHNDFLVGKIGQWSGVEVVVPEASLVDFKEALVMALIGVLRWREEKNVLASVTGASRDSIGGAVWIGQE